MDSTLTALARGLPRVALDALFEALSRMPAERSARGRTLVEPTRVQNVAADSRGVKANVQDTHGYVTRWAWGDDGAISLCSCPAGRACEHSYVVGILLLAEARRQGRWDHARWGRLAPQDLAVERAGLSAEREAPPDARHAHAVEALAHWADRAPTETRRLRAVFHLEPGPLGALLTLEVRVSGAGLDDAPRSWRQLEQLAAELKRTPTLLAPPAARLLRAIVSPEFNTPVIPPGTRFELTSERMQSLLDRVPESPHFTWSPTLPESLATRAGVEPGARASLQATEVRVVPICDTNTEPPRLELSFEWADGTTRALRDSVLLSPFGLASPGRTHVALSGGRFVRVVDEPPREVVKLLQEGGLALLRQDGAVLEKLSRSFPVVRTALQRLTRVHDVDVIGCFEMADEDWLRVRVFAASRAAQWRPGAIAPEGAVFEYRPALGWMRLSPDDSVIAGMESVDDVVAPGEDAAGATTMPAVGMDDATDAAAPPVTSVVADRKSTRLNSSHSSVSRMPSSA